MHALPADPAAVVIRWQSEGGQAGEGAEPDLVVRADGSVTVGSRLAGGRPAQGALSGAELQELLSFALDRNAFFAFDPARVARQIDAGSRTAAGTGGAGEALAVPVGPPYVDAGTAVITIAADGRRHEVRQQGLFAAAREHPEIEPLAQLRAIEVRLLELAQKVAAAAGR
jgi:hypothetical protein